MNSENYPEMWKVFIFIFTLSHGQCSVERGFNVNKDSVKDDADKFIEQAA